MLRCPLRPPRGCSVPTLPRCHTHSSIPPGAVVAAFLFTVALFAHRRCKECRWQISLPRWSMWAFSLPGHAVLYVRFRSHWSTCASAPVRKSSGCQVVSRCITPLSWPCGAAQATLSCPFSLALSSATLGGHCCKRLDFVALGQPQEPSSDTLAQLAFVDPRSLLEGGRTPRS